VGSCAIPVPFGSTTRALRSRLFDDAVGPFVQAHRGGTVVELGAGLETQVRRCDDGHVRWIVVDLPEAIAVRERFLQPTERVRHVAKSALDHSWFDAVDASSGLLVTAQGLLMYFEESEVRALLVAILDRFPGVEIVFDVIPRWLSRRTLRGWNKTRRYRTPPMPWGVDARDLERTLRAWSPRIASVRLVPFGPVRGIAGLLFSTFRGVPHLRGAAPTTVHVTSKETSDA
jgi:O-methyltransferase involved in polyketide biosynthesis